jgi:aminoglycoside phosphotransferase (APT) family kinase protein
MISGPSDALLARFGVHIVETMGGRLNQHWLVAARGERLVLRRWAGSRDDAAYEFRLLTRIAALGWPVAPAIGEPIVGDGATWSLFPYLPGAPCSDADPRAEQRARGRLLARLHADLARLTDVGQRGTWRRCETILADPALDRILAENERERADEARLLRWHLAHARERIAGLRPHELPDTIVHGDFTPWNLRF